MYTQVRKELVTQIEERHQAQLRFLADLDTRMQALSTKLTSTEDRLEARLQTVRPHTCTFGAASIYIRTRLCSDTIFGLT